MQEVRKHKWVPKHELTTKKEAEQMLKKYKTDRARLPKIFSTDPAIAHLGAKENQIIKITRCSPTAGKFIVYRRVVKR